MATQTIIVLPGKLTCEHVYQTGNKAGNRFTYFDGYEVIESAYVCETVVNVGFYQIISAKKSAMHRPLMMFV